MLGILRTGHPHWIARDGIGSSASSRSRLTARDRRRNRPRSGAGRASGVRCRSRFPNWGLGTRHGLPLRTRHRQRSRPARVSVHGGPSRQRGAGAGGSCWRAMTIWTVCQRPTPQCGQHRASSPLTLARKSSAASIATACGAEVRSPLDALPAR